MQTNTSEASDTSTNFINVKGAGNTFTGDNLIFNALNDSQTYAHNNGQAYLGLNAIVASGLASAENTSAISIDNVNNFKSNTINLTAQIGEDNKYTAQITIGNKIYGDATTLNAAALNKASCNAFMKNNAYAVVANANDISSYTVAKDKASITVGSDTAVENSNKLAAQLISARIRKINLMWRQKVPAARPLTPKPSTLISKIISRPINILMNTTILYLGAWAALSMTLTIKPQPRRPIKRLI